MHPSETLQTYLDDPRELRRLVRGLAAFARMPATWLEYDSQRMLECVAAVVLDALGADVLLIQIRHGLQTQEAFATTAALDPSRTTLRATLAPLLEKTHSHPVQPLAELDGEVPLHIVSQAVGESGLLMAGSSRADFPSDADRLLLSAGAHQAALLLRQKHTAQALHESEERFRSFSTAAPVGIFTTDLAGRFTYTNPQCQALLGFTAAEALGTCWLDFVHPGDCARIRDRWSAHAPSGFLVDFRVLHPQHNFQWVRLQTVPQLSDSGELLGHVGTLADISVQIEAEQELERRVRERTAELQTEMAARARMIDSLRESEERFQLLVGSVIDYAIFMLDPSGRVTSWNNGARRLKQYSAEEITGQHFSRFYTPADIARGRPEHLLAVAERDGHVEDEGWRVRKDGSLFWADVVITALRDRHGKLRGFAKVTRDMSERKQAEQQMQQSSERMRLLAGHLQTTREDERQRIALELHDELGQILTVAKIDLSRLIKRVHGDNWLEAASAATLGADLQAVLQSIDDGLQSMRRILQRLRPQTLDELGLQATLEAQADQFEQRNQIECHFESPAETIPLGPDVSIALFRIVQEALTNIARHAEASRVDISLRNSDNTLLLEIRDNGKGISDADREKIGHFGLLGMQERATLLGGELTLSTAPGQGTSVMVRIPIA